MESILTYTHKEGMSFFLESRWLGSHPTQCSYQTTKTISKRKLAIEIYIWSGGIFNTLFNNYLVTYLKWIVNVINSNGG